MSSKTTTQKAELDKVDVPTDNVKTKTQKNTAAKKTPKKYAPGDAIECRSVTGGKLILIGSKSQLQYTWEDYGDTAWVEYQDLQALYSRKSNFLIKPRFIIEDTELVEQW